MITTVKLFGAVMFPERERAADLLDAYLYRHTTPVRDGRYDQFDGPGCWQIVVTEVSRESIGQIDADRFAEMNREVSRLLAYQLNRFGSGLYPTRAFDTLAQAEHWCAEYVLA